MVGAARAAYVGLAWLVVVALVVQVFLAGLGLFAGSSNLATHAGVGWIVHLVPILVVVAAALSRAGRRHWQWALAAAVVIFLVPIALVLGAPVVAALHPVLAVLGFWLAVVVARNSLEAYRGPAAPSEEGAPA